VSGRNGQGCVYGLDAGGNVGRSSLDRVALVWDEGLLGYGFGRGHPLDPVRVGLTVDLVRTVGLLDLSHVDVVAPMGVAEDDLLRVHRSRYIQAVQRLSLVGAVGAAVDHSFGLGVGDTPAFPGVHDLSAAVCGATTEAARRVLSGDAIHAFSPAGGLHHAMPDRASGFCVYNDPGVAIAWMLAQGVERVAYVDTDVHHGDGVELMFADDPRVLTFSIHESGRFLFPGTGHSDDVGGPGALGSAANLPLLPGTAGDVWLAAFDAVAEPLLRAFAPDVLVTQLGCDTHVDDPLAHLSLRVDDHATIADRMHTLAHELCEGRWIATGGGGYRPVDVVPRSWTAAFAVMAGHELPDEIPLDWRDRASLLGRGPAPTSFWDTPIEVEDAVHARTMQAATDAVEAIRRLVLPRHGVR
jgi:acetoin utilization protein AcuC